MSPEQEEAIRRWRKRQIMAVAIGILAAILFLVGIAMSSLYLLGIGLGTFLLCLAGIFVGGFLAARELKS